MKFHLAALALIAFALPSVAADGPLFSHEGGFLIGGLEAFYGPDACANGGLTEGFDSNCVPLDGDYAGRTFVIIEISDDTGLLAIDPSHKAPAEVYDPASAACVQSAASGFCPPSSEVLYYPLMAACFYPASSGLPLGYLESLSCGFTGEVPEGAGKVAITASGGTHVQYTFVIT